MARVRMFHFSAAKPEKLTEFYAEVFGWDFSRMDAPNPTWYASAGPPNEPGIDGMLHTRERDNAVVNTIEVLDIESIIQSVESHGGKIIDRRTIPGAGELALFSDPEQNVFQLRQPPQQ